MHWIIRSSERVLDLPANRRVAGILAEIAATLSRGESIAGFPNLPDILLTLSRDPGLRNAVLELISTRVVNVLDDALPEDALEEFRRFSLSPEVRGRLPDLNMLSCRWDQLGTAGCPDVEPRIRWHGLDRLDRQGNPFTELSALHFTIGAGAEQEFTFEPIGSDQVPAALGNSIRTSLHRGLRMSLRGATKSNAAARLPIRFGAVGVGANASADARIDCYFDGNRDALVGKTLLRAFSNLANPFELKELNASFTRGILRAVCIEAGGSVGLDGSLTFGLRDELFANARGRLPLELGAELRFYTAKRGDYVANLYPADPNDLSRGEVRLDLHRLRSTESGRSFKLGLTLDLTPALNEFGVDLVRHMDRGEELLQRFSDFIPPSAAIRDELDGWLAENLDDEQSALLAELLGSSADADAAKRLGRRLAEGLDQQLNAWTRDADSVARAVAARVLDNINLPPTQRQVLERIAVDAARMGMEHAKGELRERIERELTDSEDAVLLQHALSTAGEFIDAQLDELDRIAERVRRRLDHVQAAVSKLAKALRESSEKKISARWRASEKRTQSLSVQQSLLFRPDVEGAAELFHHAMAGSLDQLFDRIRAASESDDNGTPAPVTLLSGAMQEFAGVESTSGFDVAFLDFDLGDQHITDVGVTFETDANGNISVRSESRSRGKRSRLDGSYTEYEVVNTFELAAARETTRRMGLSLALSLVKRKLDTDDARKFFQGFARPDVGLLSQARVASAMRSMPGAQERSDSELRAWLELDADALDRLLGLPEGDRSATSGTLPPGHRRRIFEAAVDALITGLEFSGDRRESRNLEHLISTTLRRNDIAEVIKESFDNTHVQALKPESATTDVSGQARFRTFEAIRERALSLADILQKMRTVYVSGGFSGVDAFLQHQERIGKGITAWFKGEMRIAGLAGLFSSKAGPYALAFFKVIADLATARPMPDEPAPPAPSLLASLTRDVDGVEQETTLIEDEAPSFREPLPLGTDAARLPPTRPPTPLPPSPTPPPSHHPTRAPIHTTSPGSRPMDDEPFIYPIDDKKGTTTYKSGGRKFGAYRSATRLHAGCDLLAAPKTPIRAMADGTVRRGPYPFYSGTDALEIVHDGMTSGHFAGKKVIVRYGEIKGVARGVRLNARVQKGDIIAYVGKLKSGASMLHLELYTNGDSKARLKAGGKYQRRSDVTDPTDYLDQAPSWPQYKQRRQAPPPPPPVPEPPPAPRDQLDTNRFQGLLNCRTAPNLDAATQVVHELRPGELFHVEQLVLGGAHPFGETDLWAQIKLQGRDSSAYAIAHFIRLHDPTRFAGDPPEFGAPQDRGVVTASSLRLRSAAGLNAPPKGSLARGDLVTIFEEHTAATDMPTRNLWYKVLPDRVVAPDDNDQSGYVAAHYIELEAADPLKDPDPEELDLYTKTLLTTDWAGCGPKTARQINSAVGGPETSHRLAEEDLQRVLGMASIFQDAMGKYSIPAAILAGIASRETRCGNVLKNGWSHNGEDFGVMQVNRRWKPDTSDPMGLDHVLQATSILAGDLNKLFDPNSKWTRDGWQPHHLLQGAVAAYNFGLDDVRTKERIDIGTTNDDYGADVLCRAAWFYRQPALKPFFQAGDR